jgi:hypothetical protein
MVRERLDKRDEDNRLAEVLAVGSFVIRLSR